MVFPMRSARSGRPSDPVTDRGLNDDGTIAREGALDRVPAAFAPVVDAARTRIAETFGPRLHSAYLYGSIPRGTAVAGPPGWPPNTPRSTAKRPRARDPALAAGHPVDPLADGVGEPVRRWPGRRRDPGPRAADRRPRSPRRGGPRSSRTRPPARPSKKTWNQVSTSAMCCTSPSRDSGDGAHDRVASCSGVSPAHLISSVARWYSSHDSSEARSSSGNRAVLLRSGL
jgi:hypothetical protein